MSERKVARKSFNVERLIAGRFRQREPSINVECLVSRKCYWTINSALNGHGYPNMGHKSKQISGFLSITFQFICSSSKSSNFIHSWFPNSYQKQRNNFKRTN